MVLLFLYVWISKVDELVKQQVIKYLFLNVEKKVYLAKSYFEQDKCLLNQMFFE